MALETLHFVQGLSRIPLLFVPRYLTTRFSKNTVQKQNISKIANLKISKFDSGKLVDSLSPRDGPVFMLELSACLRNPICTVIQGVTYMR